MDIIPYDETMFGYDANEFVADYIRYLFEMKENSSEYSWAHSCSKRVTFLKPFKRSFNVGAWTSRSCKVPEDAKPIVWEVSVDRSSRSLEIETSIEHRTPESIEALLKIEPSPIEGDFIEYSTYAESRYLNPIWEEDLLPGVSLHLSSGDYKCFDGLVPIQRTKKANLVFRFPRSYGLTKEDLVPFVGSYTSNVDYEVESEVRRATVEMQTFSGNVEVRMEIDSPLLRHIYGVAWNPKHRPT